MFLKRFFRRGAAFFCALLLCFSAFPAHGEFSPRYTLLSDQGGMRLELDLSLSEAASLSPETLSILNDWLSRAHLSMAVQETAEISQVQASILMDGKEALSIASQSQPDYTLTTFFPSAQAYLTAAGKPDALSLLTGETGEFPRISPLPDAYATWAAPLYELLGEMKTVKRNKTSTSIKNATASAAYENYSFTAEEMNTAWPSILDTLLPVLREYLSGQPRLLSEAEALLSSLVFSGECRFKRFLDKDGHDMGLQFTGNAAREGSEDVRKVTLFGGFTPGKGGYVSLALPAVKGKNNFKISLTGKLTQKDNQRTLTMEGSYTRTLNEEKESLSFTANLKNALKNDAEAISGKITLESTLPGSAGTWTLTPSLSLSEAGLEGSIAFTRKESDKRTLKGDLALSLAPVSGLALPSALSAHDLRLMTESQGKAAVSGELTYFTRFLMQLLASLPEEGRVLFTHDFRTDAWMNGPSVPVQRDEASHPQTLVEISQESPWIVEEE